MGIIYLREIELFLLTLYFNYLFRGNSNILSIAMMGNFACTWPSDPAVTALYAFLGNITKFDPSTMRANGILRKKYLLYGECQLNQDAVRHNKTYPDSPGAGVLYKIRFWSHWVIVHNCFVSNICLCYSYNISSPFDYLFGISSSG